LPAVPIENVDKYLAVTTVRAYCIHRTSLRLFETYPGSGPHLEN